MRLPPVRGKLNPIIIVHAVTASGLHDFYPPDQERVWSPIELALADYDRITFAPEAGKKPGDVRYEAIEPALIRPSELFGLVYKELISELKHNLSYGDVPVQPVYPFVYDWRQDNFVTIRHLAAFVDEVIARTNLMPHVPGPAGEPPCDAVDLIGHSMGGLVIAGCIARGLLGRGKASKVRRVVTLGTPFRGATTAITKLATGVGTLTGRGAKERERTTARLTPTVYQLLPSFRGALRDGPLEPRLAPEADPDDIWKRDTFQPSILDTIAEHARAAAAREGTTLKEARATAEGVMDDMLAAARQYRALTDSVDPATMLRPPAEGGAWLAILGAGEKTHIHAGITDRGRASQLFDFRPAGFSSDSWDAADLGRDDNEFTGDETVPIRSAAPPWKESWRHCVVVKRQDFGWLAEPGDRLLQDRLGLHSALPLLNLAQRWIINFLRPEWAGNPRKFGQHGRLWGRPAPAFWSSPEGRDLDARLRAAPDDRRRRELVRAQCERVWGEMIPGLSLSPLV